MSKFPIKKLQEAELQAIDEHCIIESGVLRLIAREMDSAYIFKQHQELGRFLLRCGISKNLCQGLLLHKQIHITESPYSAENILRAVTNPTPNPSKEDFEEYSREMLIYRILVFYSCGRDKNKKILFNVIENLGNPLLFHGDAPRAMRFHKKISQLLIDAGYVIKNGVVKKERGAHTLSPLPKTLTLSLKDRQIWVNNRFFLSQPHFLSGNIEFFEHLLENAGKEITRESLPKGLAEVIKKRRFPKILNAFGFKGELLKAFFSKRSRECIVFNKTVSAKELQERGVELPMLIAELSQAHSRNIQSSPK